MCWKTENWTEKWLLHFLQQLLNMELLKVKLRFILIVTCDG